MTRAKVNGIEIAHNPLQARTFLSFAIQNQCLLTPFLLLLLLLLSCPFYWIHHKKSPLKELELDISFYWTSTSGKEIGIVLSAAIACKLTFILIYFIIALHFQSFWVFDKKIMRKIYVLDSIELFGNDGTIWKGA